MYNQGTSRRSKLSRILILKADLKERTRRIRKKLSERINRKRTILAKRKNCPMRQVLSRRMAAMTETNKKAITSSQTKSQS